MKFSASHGRAPSTGRFHVLALIATLALPILGGCPGQLGGGPWPPPIPTGTGGFVGTGTGGAGPTGSGGGMAPACDAPTKIFTARSCNLSGCHGPGATPLDLSGADPFPNLMGKTAVEGNGCLGMPYVSAGNPPGGVLIKRISGSTCGLAMPGGVPLPADDIACVESWLSSKF